MDPTGLWSLSGAWNAVKSGVSKAVDWVDENKGLLTNIAVGIGVGIAVGALCATGVGCLVAAGVAAGAAGAAAGYGVDVAEGKKDFSFGGLATEVGIGAASGLAGVGVGKVIGTAGKLAGTAAGKAVTGAVNRTGEAITNTVRSAGAKAAAAGAKVAAGGAKVAKAAKDAAKSVGGRGKAADTARLTGRADKLADALDPIARNHRTAAAMSTTQGRDVLAGGVRDLNPAQRALAGADDVLAKAPGEHAEVTAMLKAADEGLTPSAIGTSRDICPACQTALQNAGAQITGPRTAVWPR